MCIRQHAEVVAPAAELSEGTEQHTWGHQIVVIGDGACCCTAQPAAGRSCQVAHLRLRGEEGVALRLRHAPGRQGGQHYSWGRGQLGGEAGGEEPSSVVPAPGGRRRPKCFYPSSQGGPGLMGMGGWAAGKLVAACAGGRGSAGGRSARARVR